ncbi:ATP-binding protein [Bifidobacterium choloepi]|nr:ATP-binding protein [Bifidobacterium choloepi]
MADNRFVGRERELAMLDERYGRDDQQTIVVYGRRRVGKTSLIRRFSQDKPTLWFTASERSDENNRRELALATARFFGEPDPIGAPPAWLDLLRYIAEKGRSFGKFIFVFDEFPYAAQAEPSLPSAMQIVLDHDFAEAGVFTILCGSNQGFMESEVLGSSSPLFGRRTAQIKLKPLPMAEAIELMPSNAAWQERFEYYAALGGTPYYLRQLAEGESFAGNMTALCFDELGPLFDEPAMLLREELREPNVYRSVLEAIAHGETKAKGIAERAGIAATSLQFYLKTLEELGLARRDLPFGDRSAKSKKSQYYITEPFFAYWFRFVAPSIGAIERGDGDAAAQLGTEGEVFDTYVGQQFEGICQQWMLTERRAGRLDILPSQVGKWWGNDPALREQADIDLIIEDDINGKMIFGECKWRNSLNATEAADLLRHRAELIDGPTDRQFYLFTKCEVPSIDGVTVVQAETMFGEH